MDADSAKLAYTEVSRAHQAITDFRAKLLALLPLASGAGFFVLLGDAGSRPAPRDLAAIGLFGFVVTLGLFLYELRGIQQCHRLREQAAKLEQVLAFAPGVAPFRDRPGARMAGVVGVESASWVVYTAVMTAWLYIAGSHTIWADGRGGLLAALDVAVLAAAWARSGRGRAALARLRHRRRIHRPSAT